MTFSEEMPSDKHIVNVRLFAAGESTVGCAAEIDPKYPTYDDRISPLKDAWCVERQGECSAVTVDQVKQLIAEEQCEDATGLARFYSMIYDLGVVVSERNTDNVDHQRMLNRTDVFPVLSNRTLTFLTHRARLEKLPDPPLEIWRHEINLETHEITNEQLWCDHMCEAIYLPLEVTEQHEAENRSSQINSLPIVR